MTAQRKTQILFGGILLHFTVVVAYTRHLNIDVAQYITMARMILDGAMPFRDVVDTNPPTIMYLSVIPVWLSHLTSLDIVRSAHVAVSTYLLGTGVFTAYVLRYLRVYDARSVRLLFGAAWVYLAATSIVIWEFGQRDQLIVAAMLPYAVLRVAAAHGRIPQRWPEPLAALLVVLALLLKPMYGTIPLVFELFLFTRSGWRTYLRRSWMLLYIAVGALCIVLFVESMRIYVFDWWSTIASYHKSYGYDIKLLLFNLLRSPAYQFAIAIVALGFFVRRITRAQGVKDILLLLLLLTLGSFLGMVVQGKGWTYHLMPLTYALWLLAAFLMYGLLTVSAERKSRTAESALWTMMVFAVLQLLLFPSMTSWLRLGLPQSPGTEVSHIIEQHSNESDYVVTVSPGIDPPFPGITYSKRRYGSRYLLAFPLVMGYAGEPTPTARPERRWLVEKYKQELWSDIQRNAPALIIVDTLEGHFFLPRPMSARTWLRDEGFFHEGPGKNYEYLCSASGGLVFYKKTSSKDTPETAMQNPRNSSMIHESDDH